MFPHFFLGTRFICAGTILKIWALICTPVFLQKSLSSTELVDSIKHTPLKYMLEMWCVCARSLGTGSIMKP